MGRTVGDFVPLIEGRLEPGNVVGFITGITVGDKAKGDDTNKSFAVKSADGANA